MAAELIDEAVTRLRNASSIDDVALVVLKTTYLLSTLCSLSEEWGIAVPVTVPPALDGLRSWFLIIKEAQAGDSLP